MADQLATPEDLAALLQSDDVDRATAELLLECATAVVQNAAGGQRIVRVVDDVVTLYLDEFDNDSNWLSLPQRPITSVGTVLIGATAVTDWSSQLSHNRLYRLYGWRSTLLLHPNQPSSVTVTYTHGYATGDQKLQLARSATLAFAAGGFTNPSGAVREQIDDYAVQYADMSARMEATPALMTALRKQYGTSGSSVRLVRGQ
jgi:hypothetical protein